MNKKVDLKIIIFITVFSFLAFSGIAYAAIDKDTGFEIVHADKTVSFTGHCDSVDLFGGTCADVKVDGSDGPLVFKSMASFKAYARSMVGGGSCFLYNPVTDITVKVVQSSKVGDLIYGPRWYVQDVNNVGTGNYKFKFYCESGKWPFAYYVEDTADVCVYDPTVGGCGVPGPGSPYKFTNVSLTADPINLTLPVSGGSVSTNLTATVECNNEGKANFTFYCNRSDAGTNITSGYVDEGGVQTVINKYKGSRKTKCSYSSPGVYTTKVIAKQGPSDDEDRVKITVTAPAKPVLTFFASPSSIIKGSTSTLIWSVKDATKCTASGGWSGDKSILGGSQSVSPSSTVIYTLTCTGPGGSDWKDATVTVTAPVPGKTPPSVDIKAE